MIPLSLLLLMFINIMNAQQTIDDYKCSFEVLSVDHNFGPDYDGNYFNFDVSDVECILGSPLISNTRYNVFYSGCNCIRTVVMWNEANGGSIGDGHGRIDDGTDNPGDWAQGEFIAFDGIEVDCGCQPISNEWWLGGYVSFPYNNILTSGSRLHPLQGLISLNHKYVALLTADCNFLIYPTTGDDRFISIYDTSTSRSANCQFIFNNNEHDESIFPGELYIRQPSMNANHWESSIDNENWIGYSETSTANRLVMQDDGNLVAYNDDNSPYWASDSDVESGSIFIPNGSWLDFTIITLTASIILLCNIVFVFILCKRGRKTTVYEKAIDNDSDAELI